MKLVRLLLAVVAIGGMTGLAYVAQRIEAAGADQVSAATAFVDSLTADQKQIAAFPYDSDERFDWNFTPQQDKNKMATRKGIAMGKLSAEQKQKALALLKAGTSQSGDETAKGIMNLENVLKEAEKNGANVRTPDWYFVTIFGTPNKSGKWGWRFEGHHLSINFTLDGMQVVTATPFFFGANPAQDPKTKTKVLGPAQELAAKLYVSLDADQKKAATADKEFPEPGEKTKNPKVGPPSGLASAEDDGRPEGAAGEAARPLHDGPNAEGHRRSRDEDGQRRRPRQHILQLSRQHEGRREALVSHSRPDVRRRVSERAGRQFRKSGESHPLGVAADQGRLRAELTEQLIRRGRVFESPGKHADGSMSRERFEPRGS